MSKCYKADYNQLKNKGQAFANMQSFLKRCVRRRIRNGKKTDFCLFKAEKSSVEKWHRFCKDISIIFIWRIQTWQ